MKLRSFIVLVAGLSIGLTACGGDSGRDGGSSGILTGAGATFPYPIYSRWFSDYARETGVRINYGSLGSGAGIRQVSEQTVDFGATDSPMTDAELKDVKGAPLLHIPTVVGAVVITYNLQTVSRPLKLSGDAIAGIFLGTITKWNDPAISSVNPDVNLPAEDILVVHRTDGSGTTYIFSDFLTSANQAWANGPGKGKQVNWPVGLGGKGNEGVAGQVKQTPGSIGDTTPAYARQNGLPVALVGNRAGNYVEPTIENIQAAAAGVLGELPVDTDFRVSIVNGPGENAYPISSLTWILLREQQADSVKGRKLVDFLRWALTEGDQQAAALDYAPLPAPVVERVFQRLDEVKLGSGG